MAIFESTLFKKLHKSVGELTFYELNGQNIIRQKAYKRDEKSPAQLAQRAKMEAVVDLCWQVADVLAIGFPAKNISLSANKFVSINIKLMQPDEEYLVNYDVTKIQFSSGELLPPKISATVNRATGTVTFTQERQPLRPLAPDDDRVWGIVWEQDNQTVRSFPLRLRCEPGETTIALPEEAWKHPLQIYAFTVGANGKKTSTTVWLAEKEGPESTNV